MRKSVRDDDRSDNDYTDDNNDHDDYDDVVGKIDDRLAECAAAYRLLLAERNTFFVTFT